MTSAVIVRRAGDLTADDEQRARRLQAQGASSFLSADKEPGPFMLFLLGDDIEKVALKTNYPKDVILLTATHYKWTEKRGMLVEKGKENELIKDIEKSLLNNILLATYQAIAKDVGEVMSGKKLPEHSKFIPQSMQALKNLLEMVEKANKLVAANLGDPVPPAAGTTVVHAQNVQINNGPVTPPTDEDTRRREFLKALAAESEVKE